MAILGGRVRGYAVRDLRGESAGAGSKGNEGMIVTRYQPVWTFDDRGVPVYFLCEVDLDAAGRLVAWRRTPNMGALGSDQTELIGDLSYMFADAVRWKPVALDDLKPGMTFQPAD